MSKLRLAGLAGLAAFAAASLGSSAGVFEAGWHADNVRPSRPKPSSKSKSTHKQNARKARKGQP